MSETIPAYQCQWKTRIVPAFFAIKNIQNLGKDAWSRRQRGCSEQGRERLLGTVDGKSAPGGQGRGLSGGTGMLRAEAGKAVRGARSRRAQSFWRRERTCLRFGARSRRARSFRSVARVRRDTRSGGAVGWGSSRRFEAVGDLLHRIATTVKQEVRVILIVGTSCPKAGLPRNRATRCGADRSVSEGYGEEGWSHRG